MIWFGFGLLLTKLAQGHRCRGTHRSPNHGGHMGGLIMVTTSQSRTERSGSSMPASKESLVTLLVESTARGLCGQANLVDISKNSGPCSQRFKTRVS